MKHIAVGVLVIVSLIRCNDNRVAIYYPDPKPDSIPVKFMPGVVTSDELDFNSTFSPDGKSFYFCRSEKGKWVIYVIHYNGKKWSEPSRATFNDPRYSEADPAFAPDGSLFFISNRPRDTSEIAHDYDIWYVKPLGDDKWSGAENLSVINSDSSELYVSFADNGNLYFSSSRTGGFGQEDIYVSKLENSRYTPPVNMGSTINTGTSDHDPLISEDERSLIFTSYERPDGFGEADFYFSSRNEDDSWNDAKNLGKHFNTPTYEYCPIYTPDGKYFFYSSEYDIKWISRSQLFREMQLK